jgi:hypothetical protein
MNVESSMCGINRTYRNDSTSIADVSRAKGTAAVIPWQWHKTMRCGPKSQEVSMSGKLDREELIKQLNVALTELHLIFRKERSKSMDVFLREEIERHGSEELLGKLLADVEEELHKRRKA